MKSNTSNSKKTKKLIALIGFMGSGKTTFGRLLSEKLNLLHLDTDLEIEKIKNMKVNEIFSLYGEKYFRELEQDTIIRIIKNNKKSVLSLGGGSFLNVNIKEYVKKNCISIWLNVNLNIIYDRLNKSNIIRPLFSNIHNKNDLEALFNKRNLIYKEADIKLNIKNLSKKEVIQELLSKIGKFN